jgi:hypothetical protein
MSRNASDPATKAVRRGPSRSIRMNWVLIGLVLIGVGIAVLSVVLRLPGLIIGYLLMVVGAVMTSVVEIVVEWRRGRSGKPGRRVMEISARRLAGLAVVIGGRSRAWRAEEFRADLIRSAGAGTSPRAWRQVRHAGGLVRGAVIMRGRDLCKPLWRLLDWTLAKPRTETLSAVAAIAAAAYFLAATGPSGLLGNLENVVAAGVLLYGPGRWLRAQRGIPPIPPRHHDELRTK